MPDDLRRDIEQYYASRANIDRYNDDNLLKEIPYYTRVKIAKHRCHDILRMVKASAPEHPGASRERSTRRYATP